MYYFCCMGRARIRGLYLAAVAILLLGAILIIHAALSRREAVQWVGHTLQVTLQAEQIESLINQAETGQRGYLLTDREDYLVPYEQSSSQVSSALEALGRLTADNPSQQRNITRLRELFDAKLSELRETIELHKGGRSAEARSLVLSGRGHDLMRQIRESLTAIKAEESALLVARQATAQASWNRQLLVMILSLVLNLALLALLQMENRRYLAAERSKTEEIQLREARFRTTLASIGDAVLTTDTLGVITFVNPVAEAVMDSKASACVGRPLSEVFTIYNEVTGATAESPATKALEKGVVIGLANHTALRRPNGVWVPIEDSAAPIVDDDGKVVGVVLVFRDVTNERRMQEALRQADRLAVAGRLAASVAHEINNPLAAVTNLIYLAMKESSNPEATARHLQLAERELKRVAHVSRQALRFHRLSHEIAEFDAAKILEEVIELYGPRFTAMGITVERAYETGLKIVGSADDLRQVISNILINSADAMSRGGELTVSAKNNSDSLVVTVEDDGHGITAENLPKIFEPFFTTKKELGTGLGLWIVKDIVEKNGGQVRVGSKVGPGGGTRVEIELPAVAPAAQARQAG
jgi:PAS domain S-box-containing protein